MENFRANDEPELTRSSQLPRAQAQAHGRNSAISFPTLGSRALNPVGAICSPKGAEKAWKKCFDGRFLFVLLVQALLLFRYFVFRTVFRMRLTVGGARFFSSTRAAAGKAGCNTVAPVHHTVKIDKNRLSPRFPGLQHSKLDIRHPGYKPTSTYQDRVAEYYSNSVQSDLLLINAQHGESRQPGYKRREWDGSSPFHLNRSLRKPKGSDAETPDIKPHSAANVPKIEAIHINCYVEQAKDNVNHAISALVQLQQITGVKPKPIYSKTNVLHWRVRAGYQMGASVVLKGRPMHQFIATLTEVVFPRIRMFKGVSNKSGDTLGDIQFGLRPDDVKFFPEIEQNQDNWSKTYGFHVNVVTSAQTDAEARTLLSAYGIPFYGSEKGVKPENVEY